MRALLFATVIIAAGLAGAALTDEAGLSVSRVEYNGWPNCVHVANPILELTATTEVGPRIIRFGFNGGRNEFWENPDDQGKTGGDEWRIYGGHRLWHSPEGKPRTYFPDNSPIEVLTASWGVRLIQRAETTTGIAKEIDIRMGNAGNSVELTHRLRNDGMWPVALAPWALSAMAPGGIAVLPMPEGNREPTGLLPNRTLTLWPYTNMTDPRVTWGRKYVLLRQDPNATEAFKVGISADDGWVAYVRGDVCFVKLHPYFRGAAYPDGGSTVECYTNGNPNMLELESVGPLRLIQPGQSVEHSEMWFLFRGVPQGDTEEWVDRQIAPLAKEALAGVAASEREGGER
jgi:hypothetical protein